MFKTIARIGLCAGLACLSDAALAQQGTSSAWGTEGWGPQIPTQSMSPFNRSWNFDHESQNRAEAGAEWLRTHGAPSPWGFR